MALYLLHFHAPYKHAQHYLGYSRDMDTLRRRIACHRTATARDGHHHSLMAAVRAAGIGFDVARIWETGDQTLERSKKHRSHRRQCPICQGKPGVDI